MTTPTLRDAFRAFTTTCAFITTNGPNGPNVMAAEWAFNVSYDPFLILVLIDPANKTHDTILETKEFGVNLVAEDQVAAMAFAGHHSKVDTDKLSSDAFETYPAARIRAPLIRGCLLTAECRLVEHSSMGDHTAFLGEVLEFTVDPDRKPVVLHHGSRALGERIGRAEGVIVSGTPMIARPGSALTAKGELTAQDRGGREVELALTMADGMVLARAAVATDASGTFRADLPLPASALRGWHILTARVGGVQGQARVRVES